MTLEQTRGELLSNRLQILNDFIVEKKGTNFLFGEYLKNRGMTEDSFFAKLPEMFSRPGIKNAMPGDVALIDYINALNQEYVKQYLNFRNIKASEDLSRGVGIQGIGVMGASEYAADGEHFDASASAIAVCNLRYPPPRLGERSRKYQACLVEETKKSEAKKEEKKEKKEEKKNSCQVGYRWSNLLNKCVKDGSLLNAANKMNPAFVLMRSSFRSIIAINLFGLATTLKAMQNQSPANWKLFISRWFKFGGDEAKLKQSIDKGSNKKMFPKLKRFSGADGLLEYSWNSADGDDEKSMTVPESELEAPPKDTGKLVKATVLGLTAGTGALASNPATAPAAAWVGSATAIIAATIPILNSFAKEKGATGLPEAPPITGIDQETKDALADDQPNGAPDKVGFWSLYKWWVIGGVAVGGVITAAIMFAKRRN